ncbi:peptidase M28 [Novosphingobium nitrogenifigens DSM 19370]|uniref:Peptidase M28 n=1 Tax=Novosphingobium nitrogenifigens DSM 19370 TaxID=983920 RepID=F1Z9W1_9SPHN|nr:M28 family peptidase [Novosphingobium nitrogenifigens]EGD58631.1 peptidase M28 [Novosphingobium nitrogenifigens DSM 19370]
MKRLLLGAALIASPVCAAPADQVSQARLKVSIDRLVAFGTRHTLSSQADPRRGIGAARAWAESQLHDACGKDAAIVKPETTITGKRVPNPTRLIDVLAVQRGSERPDEVVIVEAHIDSMRSDVMDPIGDAPGANDDGSGTALVLEAARTMCHARFPSTVVYAVLSGEEQGLYGGKLLADYARSQHWTVKAVLNNDIVGNSRSSDGTVDDAHVRVFSEGPRADADAALTHAQRLYGGENDSPSRNLSRWLAGLASADPAGLSVRQVWRADRMGRGGDHLPFEEAGYPAVRLTVAVENYEAQHQTPRVENGHVYGDTPDRMDFAYLAKVTRLNVRALTALASAPLPPTASVDGAVKTFTTLHWDRVPGALSYAVWRRRTDAPGWEDKVLTTSATTALLDGVRADDWFFGVSAIAADGSASPIASALPGGGYGPVLAKP